MSIDVARRWALPTEVSAPEPGSHLPFTDWQAAELVTFRVTGPGTRGSLS